MHTYPALVPLTDLEAQRAAGIHYPASVDAWRWLYRHRRERGLESAFRRVGRRVLVDTGAYLDAIRAQAAS